MTHALGLRGATAQEILGWYEAIVQATTDLTAGRAPSGAAADAVAQLRVAVEGQLEGDSLLADAAHLLTRGEVTSNAATLLFGGIETTEGMIANALLHLLDNPSELTRVREDPSKTPNAIEESLRLEPAAATIDRYATHDHDLGPARIKQGDPVTISIAAANRDPRTFPDPDRFDATRPNAKQHLAFAHGPHVCIGMHLARLEAHTAVTRVLERLPNLTLQSETKPRGLVFRKPPALRVSW
jgi:cytochrome P450